MGTAIRRGTQFEKDFPAGNFRTNRSHGTVGFRKLRGNPVDWKVDISARRMRMEKGCHNISDAAWDRTLKREESRILSPPLRIRNFGKKHSPLRRIPTPVTVAHVSL